MEKCAVLELESILLVNLQIFREIGHILKNTLK